MCIDTDQVAHNEGQSFTSSLQNFSRMTRTQQKAFLSGARVDASSSPSINATLAVIESLAGRV